MRQYVLTFKDSPSPYLTRWLLAAAAATLALRVWIALALPITGDEAFFYWWGVYPDWGYYDHPPMVGWLIGAMRWLLGDTLFTIRLPVILLPLVLGAALWWGLSSVDKTRAAWAVLLFWLAPLNWLNTLITTDTPLIFWSVLSACTLMNAEQRARVDNKAWLLYATSGLFLGCAFLSKYFSVVLGLAYLVYFLAFRRDRLLPFAVLVLCALPGPAINLGWNMSHGWPNVMFNVYNRNQDAVFAWTKPALYAATLLYLVTPGLAVLGWKHRQSLRQAWREQRLLGTLVVVPLMFFAVLSLKKVIGLHWVLAFYPFGFAWLAFALPMEKLKTAAQWILGFAALHVVLVLAISMSSLEQWASVKIYPQIVRSVKTDALLKQVMLPNVVLMADAYTPASVYGYQLRSYVPVFGPGKFHARQDDMLVDFSIYAGKTIRIMQSGPPDLADYQPYFESTRVFTVVQNAATFYMVEGVGFKFEAYRKGVLATIFNRYYAIPTWLPMTGCPFCERYCGEVRCPR